MNKKKFLRIRNSKVKKSTSMQKAIYRGLLKNAKDLEINYIVNIEEHVLDIIEQIQAHFDGMELECLKSLERDLQDSTLDNMEVIHNVVKGFIAKRNTIIDNAWKLEEERFNKIISSYANCISKVHSRAVANRLNDYLDNFKAQTATSLQKFRINRDTIFKLCNELDLELINDFRMQLDLLIKNNSASSDIDKINAELDNKLAPRKTTLFRNRTWKEYNSIA